ncbi:MAG: D-hexose-6-phosphate mutarotase [Gammaproteobacteria bacterium]|nr:D-hexose-6-phosphate mutarotase [Gammaproteobacteria bacterium]MCW9031967.1 D-hexose-6-phosphate mutarotase [Gammaproteobacteria bacterium]
MTMPDINDLNKNFSINSHQQLSFKLGEGGIPNVEIVNDYASALISLQGAHVLSWKPKGEEDVIWLSSDATFAMGKSVRGGVPICWPWFGAHESVASFPAHGFARTVLWPVIKTTALESGETQIIFRLDTSELDEKLQAMWPQATVAEYRITIGKTLTFELISFNNSADAITIGQALHTYFNIDDISQTTVTGLEGKDYLDKTRDFERKNQSGPITINEEVDRVYLQTADDIVIDDSKRKIHIEKHGSSSTVVWNPWKEVADKMGDLGKAGYRHMLCVESANAAEDVVSILPGESHTLQVTYKIN